jgi:hypothetical protein
LEISPNIVTFTFSNWDAAQSISMKVVDDDVAENGVIEQLGNVKVGRISSFDRDYHYLEGNEGLSLAQAFIDDNDETGLIVSKTELTVQEGLSSGDSTRQSFDEYSIKLQSDPFSSVTVRMEYDTDQVVVLKDGQVVNDITFSTSNWDTPQVLQVQAINDAVD